MKKKILALTLLLAIVASMFVFAACKDDEQDEPEKLLGGFLSPEKSEGNSIIAPFISCAYESDRFVFDIDDVTLTFYIMLNSLGDTEEGNRRLFGDSYFIDLLYTNSEGQDDRMYWKTVDEPIYSEKYLSTDEHPRGYETEMTLPKEVFAQDSGEIVFGVTTILSADGSWLNRGVAIMYYTKESEDIVRLSAFEPIDWGC